MPVVYVLLIFLAGVVFFTFVMLLLPLGEYRRFAGRRSVTCPETKQRVDVEVDRGYVFRTTLRGCEHIELQSCSHWPERRGCDQDCLSQIEPTPTYLNRVLGRWYEGKNCVTCGRKLTPADWQRSRLGLLGTEKNLVEIQDFPKDNLPGVLDRYRPLCWACHGAEVARRPAVTVFHKGDRRLKQKSLAEQFSD